MVCILSKLIQLMVDVSHVVIANQALHGNTKVRGPWVEGVSWQGYIGCEP